ncbi:hypothetical protein ANCCEY_05035 [Ancylostoma ceylanicum]|uniref:SAM domain-containing protein n=2 Tax=Ancylostoma ceylanicum TaxID=53326 RepID=A0A0D6LV02_9BILA|nr:hypothetical protein ANCCEY_05035 [Ancylostoma ceylanicum]
MIADGSSEILIIREQLRFCKMRLRLDKLVLFVLFACCYASGKHNGKATRNVVVTAEEEKIRDAAGYNAIAEIHREMDDDHSGSIDRKETTGFMMEDMHMRGSDRTRREHAFHGDDDAITVDDLWEAWFESDERAWTTEQVLNWIVNEVNLPMYADRITELKIDGTVLPRLAVHNSTFMTNQLGIKSSVHRQKLRLNALDVVLFGHRDPSSKGKDIALALLLLLLTSVLILYAKQRRRARLQVTELSQKLKELKNMENEFDSVQKKWHEERSKRSTSDGGVSQVEVDNLRVQLEEAERRLEENGVGGVPLALQPLLRKTCEVEMAFLEKQKQECVKEMRDAIELVDRLQKKQSSVISSLKLATGASSSSDQVDSKIFALNVDFSGLEWTKSKFLHVKLKNGGFRLNLFVVFLSSILTKQYRSCIHQHPRLISIRPTQVLNWIVNEVNLPMYADRITELKIDGTVLPRLAVHNSTFMTNQLGIKSSVHRQKLRLNALDVVLFGHRDPSSKGKDIALALLVIFTILSS